MKKFEKYEVKKLRQQDYNHKFNILLKKLETRAVIPTVKAKTHFRVGFLFVKKINEVSIFCFIIISQKT
jgi:hypothetical protein